MQRELTIAAPKAVRVGQRDHWAARWGLTTAALGILGVLVVVPVANVFVQAFAGGVQVYWDRLLGSPDTHHAILLTLIVAPISVVLNLVFGVAAAWLIARFRFPGRT